MDADVIVIGAGACGLAIAAKFSSNRRSVILLEKESTYGTGVSSRSTEIIHAGIYYKTGSLKSRLCLIGKSLLYDFCEKHNVKHRRIGKLFLAATKDDVGRLEVTEKQAVENGVADLEFLDSSQIKKLEPNVTGHAAILSPSSGIFDSHGFMRVLFRIAKSNGAIFSPSSPVAGAEYSKDGWDVHVNGQEDVTVRAKVVVNSTGLYAIKLSKHIFPGRETPTLYPIKGSYLRYSGNPLVRHIIYPAIKPGLIEERVDATPDLGESLRFGPDVDIPEDLGDFAVPETLKLKMAGGIKRFLPQIDMDKVHLDCAGIRPRIYGACEEAKDFIFDWAPIEGWLDLWGIESPGLTAALAIADYVYDGIIKKGLL